MVEVNFVVVVETPSEGGDAALPQPQQQPAFCLASKAYYLHVQAAEERTDSLLGASATHYAGLPHEAFFDGAFLERSAAQSYLTLFDGEPYSDSAKLRTLSQNVDSLSAQVHADFSSGAHGRGLKVEVSTLPIAPHPAGTGIRWLNQAPA